MTLYRRYNPGDSWDYIWDELPMKEGLAYIAGGMSNDFVLQAFGGLEMKGGGFVGQEVSRLTEKAR